MSRPSQAPLISSQIARKIEKLLSDVISLQRDHVERLCAVCKEPCCKKVSYPFEEKDFIFARVLGHRDRPARKGEKTQTGCPYLSATGCVLTPKARPFTCHRYLCPVLVEAMTRHDPGLVPRLTRSFRTLEHLRGELWKAYLEDRLLPEL